MYWFYSCSVSRAESTRGRLPFRLIIRVAGDKWASHEKDPRFLCNWQMKIGNKTVSHKPSWLELRIRGFYFIWLDAITTQPFIMLPPSFSWMEMTLTSGSMTLHHGKKTNINWSSIFNISNWRYYYIAGTAIVLGIIAVCLFPLWPMEARQVGLKSLGKLISWKQIISFDFVSFNLFLPIPARWMEKVLNHFFGNLSNHKIGGRLLSFHCNFYLLPSHPIYLNSIIV